MEFSALHCALYSRFPLPRHRLRRCHSLSGEGEFYKCLVGGKQNKIIVPR